VKPNKTFLAERNVVPPLATCSGARRGGTAFACQLARWGWLGCRPVCGGGGIFEQSSAWLGGGGIFEQSSAWLGGGGIFEQSSAWLGGGGMAEQETFVLGGGGISVQDSVVLGGGGMRDPGSIT
jgi:hypothetical protein